MQTNYANLFSTEPLDRLEEIYLKTMNEMDDPTLQAFCSSAKYNAKLCDDSFWLRRIKDNNLELLLPYRSLYSSLASFYFNVRKDACYIVGAVGEGEEDVYVFNDIYRARRAFSNLVNEENGMDYDDDNEDTEPDYAKLTSMYEIYVLFNNVVLTKESILPYSIFNLRKDSTNYLNPSIVNFPLLSHAHKVLYYVKRDNESRFLSQIAILPFDSQHLRLLPENAQMSYITTDSVATFELPYIWSKESFGIVTYAPGHQVFILVDTSLLSDSGKTSVANWSTMAENGEYVFIILDQSTYLLIQRTFMISERSYKEGKSLEPLSPSIVIEALLTIKAAKPINELQRALDYNR